MADGLFDPPDPPVRGRRRRRIRRRDRFHRAPASPATVSEARRSDAAAPSPEELAYRVARRRANAKITFLIHLVVFSSVIVLILFTGGLRPAFLTALAWGIGLSVHYFVAVVAPDLRKRLIENEVENRISVGVTRQRRDLEEKHARSLEELSAAIAHEIRNPITAAKSLVQQMGEDTRADENVTYARVALDELARVERSVAHLLRYAREEEIEITELCMAEVLDSALETFRDRFQKLGVEVRREVDSEGRMRGDAEKLRRVIINLVGNSLDALEGAGTPAPRLAVAVGENLAGTEVWIRIRDNGPGIDPERLPKIFRPFYTSKSNGTGLGLAISKKVVDAHGGSIEAHSSPGQGCEFVLTLPKAEHDGAPPPQETA
jgi:signal transduction histidine kinase